MADGGDAPAHGLDSVFGRELVDAGTREMVGELLARRRMEGRWGEAAVVPPAGAEEDSRWQCQGGGIMMTSRAESV